MKIIDIYFEHPVFRTFPNINFQYKLLPSQKIVLLAFFYGKPFSISNQTLFRIRQIF